MGESLFDRNHQYLLDARILDSKTINLTERLFEEYIEMGYSPREIEYIMTTAIKDISLSHTV